MKKWVVFLLACWVGVSAWGQGVKALEDPLEGKFRSSETTIADQTDIAVTVYNNNVALVRDRRQVALFPGEVSLAFMDVAQQIRPETVSLRSISSPGAVRILEQNYEFDLMSPAKLMEKFVGQDVRLVNFSNQVGFTEVRAKLLSINQGPIYEVDGEIFLGHPGTVVLPDIPENLIAKPSLIWLLDSDDTDQEIEVSYLTGGISWKADYVVTLTRDETSMDLEGWVTLNNQSGAQYKNAQLKLVAGEVHMAPQIQRFPGMAGNAMKAARASEMRQESFGEFHLYSLERRTTIKENQSKQVSLLTASDIGVEKIYEFRGNAGYYIQKYPRLPDQKVAAFLKFKNSKENNLGMPLPAGVMRVYQEDSDGMLQFGGEDRIGHTPKDEDVRLKVGNAFDVVGERIQEDYSRIANNLHEAAFEIKLRNHKEKAVTVDVIEPMGGDWQILESSHEFVKRDAFTAVFSVGVPVDGETVIRYRVRVRY